MASAVGLDVGTSLVHGVRLEGEAGRLAVTACFTGGVSPGLIRFCAGAARVAVDAPGGPSRGAHTADGAVAAKFRTGRCSEIPVPGVPPVPWVTPRDRDAAPAWMLTGFEVWALLREACSEVVETFPAAAFHRLNGGRWPPPKTTTAGREARVRLLAGRVELPGDAGRWPHDLLDAAVAALAAATGEPLAHRCSDPDGSRMWLPPADGRPQRPVDRSASAAMLRTIPPKTTEWNGDTAHQ